MNHQSRYAPVILRLGLAGVFLWFGTTQLLDQAMWTSLIPDWLVNLTGISAASFVVINSLFEVVFGVLLVLGVWTRVAAALLFLHLLTIIFDVRLTAIGVRDIGLAIATLSIAIYGNDVYSWSQRKGFAADR